MKVTETIPVQREDETGPSVGGSNACLKPVFIIAGTVFLALGLIGVFLPILPTTPFLLLAAACYGRGSERMYRWLLTNRWFGDYVADYRAGKGIRLRLKILTVSLLWLAIGCSSSLVIPGAIGKIAVLVIAAAVTTHIVRFMPLDIPV